MPVTIFKTLTSPQGVAFDSSGNLYVSGLVSFTSLPGIPPSEPAIIKFASDGTVVGQVRAGLFSAPKLEFVPEIGALFALSEDGLFQSFNSNTLNSLGSFDLNDISTDTSAIYDIVTGQISNFGGAINTQLASFGDFDIRVAGDITQVFIAGYSQAQAFPFVLRLEFQNNVGLTEAKVILASSADALSIGKQTPRLNRGIAVNAQGVVLTSLPLPATSAPIDVPIAIGADFDAQDGLSQGEVPAILNQVDVYSQGITTDTAGNFYIATNSVGSGTLGVPGEGALIVLSADLTQFVFAQGIGVPLSSFRDVAINPTNKIPFVTADGFFPPPAQDDLLVAFPEAAFTASISSVGVLTTNNSNFDDLLARNSATTETFNTGIITKTMNYCGTDLYGQCSKIRELMSISDYSNIYGISSTQASEFYLEAETPFVTPLALNSFQPSNL
jgi:hypothetical protein